MPMNSRSAGPLNPGKTPVPDGVTGQGAECGVLSAERTVTETGLPIYALKLFVLDTRGNCWYLVAVWKFCLKKNGLSPWAALIIFCNYPA